MSYSILNPTPNSSAEYAALLLRISLGVMYIAHGLLKVLVFTLPGTAQFFESAGFPGWLAYPVAFAEIGGGLMLIAGIATRVVILALIPVLIGALSVHFANGWVFSNSNGGWEYPAFLIAVSAVQALLGNGAYAANVARRRSGDALTSVSDTGLSQR